MAWFTNSEPFVAFAWVAGLTSVALSFVLTLQVLRMRWRTARRARRRAEFLATWRPLLFEAAVGGAPATPRLAREDEDSFVVLWNQIQDSLEVGSRDALNRIAENVGADLRALTLLRPQDPVRCVQALRMLGHLRRRENYPAVHALLEDPRPYLSIAAARTLIALHPVRALQDVLPRIAARADWPASLLVTAFAGVDREWLGDELGASISSAQSPVEVIRLLPLVALVPEPASEEILRRVFGGATDPEVVAAVLKHVRTPALRDLARAGCDHDDWRVRTQAAAALGRVGTVAERPHLITLLSDLQWWVRYRAAEAIVSPRFGRREDLAALMQQLPDPYARDILSHAAAETRA